MSAALRFCTTPVSRIWTWSNPRAAIGRDLQSLYVLRRIKARQRRTRTIGIKVVCDRAPKCTLRFPAIRGYIIRHQTRLAPSLYSIVPRLLSIGHYTHDRTNLKHTHQALALNRRHKNASNLPLLHPKPSTATFITATMFSCANYERGCRGRCNDTNGRCDSCVVLNLQSTRSNSASSVSSTNGRPAAAYSALTSSFASLSSAATSSQKAS